MVPAPWFYVLLDAVSSIDAAEELRVALGSALSGRIGNPKDHAARHQVKDMTNRAFPIIYPPDPSGDAEVQHGG